MKKVLSLVLAFAMILGSFGFVFASDFPDVSDTEYYSEPVNVLSGFGVIGGFPDGTFGPEKEVTRAQMATMIVNALGMTVTGKSDTKFSDVPASHWASGFIAYATSVGFVAGYPDGTFKPDNPVTYDQALTMIVAALGYSAESLPGTWPGNFVNKAQGLGILDICKTTGTTNAPRQDIACFLYKALTQPIGYTDKDGAFNANRGADGIVGTDTMLARLGATPFNGGKAFVYDGSQPSAINLKPYLGAFITAYQNKDKEIVALKEVLSEFVEGEYKSDKTVDGKKFDTATNLAPAAAGDDYTGSYVGFLNGEVNGTVSSVAAGGAMGDVKVAVKMTGTKVSTVYSVQVWNENSVFRADKDIQDTINEDKAFGAFKFVLNDADEIDVNEFELVGRGSLAEIAEDDILSIYANTKGEITKIEVGTETAYGTVSKVTTGTPAKYTIGDTAYAIDATWATAKAKAVDVDDEGTFYLSYSGDIIDFDAADDSTSSYGIILSIGSETSKYDATPSYSVKMLLADGSEKEFDVKNAGVLTGAKDDAGAAAALSTTKGDYGLLVKYTVNSSDVITGFVNANAGATTFDKNGVCGGVALKSSSVAFEFTGDPTKDLGKASAYKILAPADLYDQTVTTNMKVAKDGAFNAVLITGLSGASDSVAIFVSKDAKTGDGYVWTALYEGKVQEITFDGDYTVKTITTSPFAVTAGDLFTMTFDSSNIVTSTPSAATAPKQITSAVDVTTANTTVANNVLTDGSNVNFSLDPEIEVYVYDVSDDAWTAKDMNYLAARKGSYTSITLIKLGPAATADDYYDIAIVVKP